jgi:DNA topoisomerase-1
MKLVIVESPTKANTIKKFLEKDYNVIASYGHIRDLPKSKFGIDIENNFNPTYIIPTKTKKRVNEIKKLTQKSDLVILATDPDREGEAIAWHLLQVLNLKDNYQRIVFHEITKEALKRALENPRKIDLNLVLAQQARRILDRIVGYKLSPFLWAKIAKRLSAGRVQSAALRLICEREKEIQNFVPQEYWQISVLIKKIDLEKSTANQFEAILFKKDGKVIPKLGLTKKEEVDEILKDLKESEFRVKNIEKKEVKRNPLPPFTTSTLQQEAWQKFKFPAKLTMQLAQRLYETGLITYHRTDSLNLSDLALSLAKNFILKNYGSNYYQLRKYKTKSKVAQEAHEAIRPTFPDNTPEKLILKLDKNQLKLYTLIWQRFIASQMAPAIFNSTNVEIEAKVQKGKSIDRSYILKATGQSLKFDGFLKIYPIEYKEKEIPHLEKEELLKLIKLIPSQHFTQPPPRYTEASLVKELEKNGIGRPSTYATIISTLQERNYVQKNKEKKFVPTEIGLFVNDILLKHFPEIVDLKFTAKMEDNLDKIAKGEKNWLLVLKEFYDPFEKNLQKKYQEVEKIDYNSDNSEEKKVCPLCGAPLVVKFSKFGKFYACSNFPNCKYTAPIEEKKLGIKCPKCKEGEIIEKRTKKGKIFYSCSNWPECDFALWDKPTGDFCPKCGSLLVEKGKVIKCSNKDCDYKKDVKK